MKYRYVCMYMECKKPESEQTIQHDTSFPNSVSTHNPNSFTYFLSRNYFSLKCSSLLLTKTLCNFTSEFRVMNKLEKFLQHRGHEIQLHSIYKSLCILFYEEAWDEHITLEVRALRNFKFIQ